MNGDEMLDRAGRPTRTRNMLALAVFALGLTACSSEQPAEQPATEQAKAAADRPNLSGFYLTHSVALDDPRWRIEDLACRGSCSLSGFHHLQELLADPKNNDRPVKELLHEVDEFTKKENAELMTASAKERAAKFDPHDDPVIEECKPDRDGWRHQLLAPLPLKIEQYDDKVLLRYEYWNAVRTVYMNGSVDPSGTAPTRLGHSTGRYEGKTLVVETAGISPNLLLVSGMGSIVHSDQAHTIERYTLTDDGNRLDLEWSFMDPENFVRPMQGQKSFLSSADGELEEFTCESVTGKY